MHLLLIIFIVSVLSSIACFLYQQNMFLMVHIPFPCVFLTIMLYVFQWFRIYSFLLYILLYSINHNIEFFILYCSSKILVARLLSYGTSWTHQLMNKHALTMLLLWLKSHQIQWCPKDVLHMTLSRRLHLLSFFPLWIIIDANA